jgi:hypothetical protein
MRLQTILIIACAAFSLIAAPASAQTPSGTSTLFGTNLVVNGDAESDTGAPSNSQVVKPTGWTTTGEFTAVQYGASGGFPDKTSPGPSDRGKNFFGGGNVAKSTTTQTIDLSSGRQAIDSGGVTYVLTGWLGGYSAQADNAQVTVTFLSAAGGSLGSGRIGPVTPADRHGATGFFKRTATGSVPAQARAARVVITATRFEGSYNDGYSDDVSLFLEDRAVLEKGASK